MVCNIFSICLQSWGIGPLCEKIRTINKYFQFGHILKNNTRMKLAKFTVSNCSYMEYAGLIRYVVFGENQWKYRISHRVHSPLKISEDVVRFGPKWKYSLRLSSLYISFWNNIHKQIKFAFPHFHFLHNLSNQRAL